MKRLNSSNYANTPPVGLRCTSLLLALLLSITFGVGQMWGAVNGDLFERISAAPSANDEIIFVKQSNDGACGAINTAGRNRSRVSIATSDNQYIYDSDNGVVVFTVKTNNSGELGFHDGTGYLYSASNSNNYMGTNTTAASTAPSGTAAWSSSVSSSVFTLSNVTNTSYYLGFNTSSALFAQYKTGQSKPYIYKKVMSAPTAVAASDITTNGATITITDGTNVNNYELYYGTSSTAPTASSTATTTITSGKSKSITGLNSNTTYYVWARAYSSSPARKTGWVALTGSSFKTESAAPVYTITAQSNNTNYGTVSLSGSVITGSPKANCRYASPTYTVSPANSATVSQSGNAFTVTPTANTTVTINFEAIPTHKAYFYNGATLLNEGGTSIQEGAAVSYSGSTPESCDTGTGASTTFAGWATGTWDGKVAKNAIVPNFYESTLPVMGNVDVTYHAVFCKGGSLTYATSIAANDVVYLATSTASGASGVAGANSNGKDADVSTTQADWMAFTVQANSTGWKLKNGSNYIQATAKNFAFTTGTPNVLTFEQEGSTGKYRMIFTIASGNDAGTYALSKNSSGTYWRFYKTSNSYNWYYVVKASASTNYMTTCCNELGSINGSFFWTTHFCPVWPAKHRS